MARPGAEEAYGIYAGIITPFGRFLMCLRYEHGGGRLETGDNLRAVRQRTISCTNIYKDIKSGKYFLKRNPYI